ncbi:hypothetical protein IC582_030385 [Cucumis melo]
MMWGGFVVGDFDWEGADGEEAWEGGGGGGGAERASTEGKEEELETAEPTNEEADGALEMDGMELERNVEEEEEEGEN